MKVSITKTANRITANAADLAAEYKYRGFERHYAWDMFVKERGLKPEMNAKEFYAIFDSVSPCPIDRRAIVEFDATHMDTLLDVPCQITDDERGVHHIVWSHGVSGSNPPCDPTFAERFLRLPTPLAPDAGDSAASSGIVNASAESTSQAESAPPSAGEADRWLAYSAFLKIGRQNPCFPY